MKKTGGFQKRWVRIAFWFAVFVPMAMAHPEGLARRLRATRPSGASRQAKPPHILIIIGDDHAGGSLGIDGDPRQATPRLDRLARQGVRFDRAFCNAPVCTASRQSLITGRLPHAVGVTRLLTPLPDDALTLGDWLGDLGYDTVAIGKMHFNSEARHGFAQRVDSNEWSRWLDAQPPAGGGKPMRWRPFQDPAETWLNAEARPFGLPLASMEATYFVDHAAEVFERHKSRDQNSFAMVLGFHEPHAPFKFPDEWQGRYRADQFSVPLVNDADRLDQPRVFAHLSAQNVQGIQAAYFTSLSYMDHQVGRVLDALEASGLADDTIVVYLGDNGYLLGQHGRFEKHSLYEPAVRVPLIIRWPGHLPPDRKVNELVELVDLVPTLLELAGQPLPPDLHGQSLRALALGEPGARGRDVVVSEYLENEEAMARSSRYKLIVGTGARRRQDGYASRNPLPGPYERLFDLEADPGETTNLSTRSDLAPVVEDLRHHLHDRLVSTRGGRTSLPPGLSQAEALEWCLVPQD